MTNDLPKASPEDPHSRGGAIMGMEKWLNKVHQGDCIEIMNQMPERSIDLVVTSPQYNLRNSTGGGMRHTKVSLWKNAAPQKGYDGGNTRRHALSRL